MRPGDQYPYGTPAYSIASYDKMATNMVALRALLGDEAFLSSYRTYGLRWQYKHPTQYDFFNSFNSLGGQRPVVVLANVVVRDVDARSGDRRRSRR